MKRAFLICMICSCVTQLQAQFFSEEVKHLYQLAEAKNDTLQLYNIQKAQTGIDIQSTKFNYLPKIGFQATYTRLNDDIVFPQDMQQLLMGTQALLAKEKLGLGFNTALPGNVPLKPVPAIQEKDILKTTVNGQWLLFSGLKVSNGVKAYQHQEKVFSHLSESKQAKLWLEISDLYDKMALLKEADNIIASSESFLNEQGRFVSEAIKNGLATPLERKRIELAQQKLEVKKMENNNSKTLLINKLHEVTGAPTEDLASLQPKIQPVLLTSAPATEQKAEIRALNEGIQATMYQEKAALAEYVPKVAAFGQYEMRDKDLSLLDPKWFAGVRLQWNIFDGLAAKNNAKKVALQRQALQVQKKSAEDAIELGQKKFREDYLLASQKVHLKQAEIKLTEDTYDFVNKQYRNGLSKLTDVLDAINDIEKARFDKQQALYEQRRAALQAADVNGTLLKNL
ncbi:MAG: TolC family protein [Niabella sp.]